MRTAARGRFFRSYLYFYKIYPKPYANTASKEGPAAKISADRRQKVQSCPYRIRSNRHTECLIKSYKTNGVAACCCPHPIQSKKALRPAGRSPLYTINNFICNRKECQEIVTKALFESCISTFFDGIIIRNAICQRYFIGFSGIIFW